ncbi:hypothetical protein LINPERPRIM_LOCUS16188 [Linum perenne]
MNMLLTGKWNKIKKKEKQQPLVPNSRLARLHHLDHASLSPIVDTTSFNFRNPQIRASLYFLAFPNTSTFATNRQISGVVVVTRTIALKIAVVFLVWSSTSTALMVGDLHDLQLGMPQRSSLSRKEEGGRLGKTALEDGIRPLRKL